MLKYKPVVDLAPLPEHERKKLLSRIERPL